MNGETIDKLVIAALPHAKDYVTQYGVTVHFNLIDQIEEKLLQALQDMLDGKAADAATLERAATIIKAASEFQQAASSGVTQATKDTA